MRSRALTLTTFKVAIRSRSGSLACGELVRVHTQTHRTTGETPLSTKVFEYLVESFFFRLDTNLL
jgi:hypothetical protein